MIFPKGVPLHRIPETADAAEESDLKQQAEVSDLPESQNNLLSSDNKPADNP